MRATAPELADGVATIRSSPPQTCRLLVPTSIVRVVEGDGRRRRRIDCNVDDTEVDLYSHDHAM